MARVLYDHLLTESGFDLLTESGDELVTRVVGMAGDVAVTGGQAGTVAGSGRLVLRGTCTASGKAGTAAGSGRVIGIAPPVTEPTPLVFIPQRVLRGRGTASGGPPGQATGKGHLTLVGKATAKGTVGQVAGKGDAFDEVALILALCA